MKTSGKKKAFQTQVNWITATETSAGVDSGRMIVRKI